ncbi:Short-chain-enoyl-CoA hydratase [Defluviimonas aquaemixtae]|uniref:Short-chain-enoyl-CoA hydratase n=1 Tax=Albidovulum aquaemixtae TaxID=1542388 RepID=A0A2R8BKJ4_9RHOB|nr:enoyl-CoA hydratase/isomerase family protein [Defluviimonas aquaemixtae]SPH23822.1 Short-chain-enoyl-CoA hydratase [Defluviimonas aquaemixtae]
MIRLEKDGALWRVTITRVDKANSLTAAMLAEIVDAAEAAVGAGVRTFVLTAEGKVFSAGADLEEMKSGLSSDPVWERASAAIAALPCLTVAALNGTLAGGAFGVALACDIRIAVSGAEFFYPVMQRGYLPQPSDPPRLEALIGPSRARMILLAGARIGAEEALAWGLVDRVVALRALTGAVETLTADALAAETSHVAEMKGLFRPQERV